MGEEQRKAAISWKYCERDVILYALSVGCAASESRYVYENDNSFSALPTFGVLTLFNGAMELIDMSKLVPNFNPVSCRAFSCTSALSWLQQDLLGAPPLYTAPLCRAAVPACFADEAAARRAVFRAASPFPNFWNRRNNCRSHRRSGQG